MARYAFFNVASSASSVTDRTLRASTRLMAVAYYEISSAIFVITIVTHILGSLEAQRRARRAHKTIHSSNAMAGKKARAREKESERRDANAANAANAGEAFPRLPNHLVATHILRSEYFDDDADLARLPAVSRAMRDLVAETGLWFKELDEKRAVELGCVSAVQRMQRQGRLSRQELLCQAAARSGQLEELKVLRARGRLAVGPGHVLGGGFGRAPRGATVGARERLSLGHTHVP